MNGHKRAQIRPADRPATHPVTMPDYAILRPVVAGVGPLVDGTDPYDRGQVGRWPQGQGVAL